MAKRKPPVTAARAAAAASSKAATPWHLSPIGIALQVAAAALSGADVGTAELVFWTLGVVAGLCAMMGRLGALSDAALRLRSLCRWTWTATWVGRAATFLATVDAVGWAAAYRTAFRGQLVTGVVFEALAITVFLVTVLPDAIVTGTAGGRFVARHVKPTFREVTALHCVFHAIRNARSGRWPTVASCIVEATAAAPFVVRRTLLRGSKSGVWPPRVFGLCLLLFSGEKLTTRLLATYGYIAPTPFFPVDGP